MRLIIDTNIIHKVFDTTHSSFDNYKIVHKCLFKCKGKMVLGGSTFEKEISLKGKYQKLLIELKRNGRLIILVKEEVDSLVNVLKKMEKDNDFDDPHIIACIILFKVNVVCTDDARADKFIAQKKLYPKYFQIPKIYRNKSHSHLMQPCFP